MQLQIKTFLIVGTNKTIIPTNAYVCCAYGHKEESSLLNSKVNNKICSTTQKV